MPRSRTTVVALALLLVALAFARAQFVSSTGIRIVGDGADYEVVASTMELRGRAPFVYRPAVPLLVGMLFPGNLTLGFALVCAASMFAALLLTGVLAPDRAAGYGLMVVLFLNYQVLFAAANVARLNVVVLAVQVGFVGLALRGNATLFFTLLPLCAVLKESLLLSLAALALLAFPRRRATLLRMAAAGAAFVAIHLAVRSLARTTSYMPPYSEGSADPAALLSMFSENLSLALPLHFFVAWSGLCFFALWAAHRGGGRRPSDPALLGICAVLLVFPLPLVTDVHRAWFELFAPITLFLVLSGSIAERRSYTLPALGSAFGASFVPYALRFVAAEHLHLEILRGRYSFAAVVALVVSLVLAALALGFWLREPHGSPQVAEAP